MASFLIGFFTVVLVLASLFIIFLVLLQRGSGQGGMGTAFGGGAVEGAFGGDTNRVLTRTTVISAIIFFVVGMGLYLGQLAAHKKTTAPVAIETALKQAEAETATKRSAATPAAAPQPGEATAEANKLFKAEETKTPATTPTDVAPVTVPAATPAAE